VEPFHLFLLTAGILNFAGGVLSVASWGFVRRKYEKTPDGRKDYRVSVIVPSRGGIDVKAMENQDYEDYEIIVVVDEEEEKREVERRTGEKTRVIISEKYPSCSGKNSALLTGIKHASGDVFLFADDDILPHEKWISHMVSSMDEVSTTYRWYFSPPMLCVWNAAVAAVMFYPRFNFAWGGSTAIKREVFEKYDIENIWKRELVDDLTLTRVMKENGVKIKFVPQAMVESMPEENIFSWMNREFAWLRYYFPSLWAIALFFNAGMRISNIAGALYMFIDPLVGMLLLSSLLFDFVRGWQEYATYVHLMEYPKHRFLHPLYHFFLRPVASFIIFYNMISSAFIRKINWKGREYSIQEVFRQT